MLILSMQQHQNYLPTIEVIKKSISRHLNNKEIVFHFLSYNIPTTLLCKHEYSELWELFPPVTPQLPQNSNIK